MSDKQPKSKKVSKKSKKEEKYSQLKEDVSKESTPIVETKEDHRVGEIHEAEEFLVDNEYIRGGYRIKFNSITKIFRSLFMVHNESVNVWSHLLGAIFVFVLIFYTTIFIRSHKEIITNFDFSKLNSEISELTQPIVSSFNQIDIDLKNIASSYYNKTADYIILIDNQIGEYAHYLNQKINCLSCLEEILASITTLKNNISQQVKDYKDSLVKSYHESEIGEKIEQFENKLVEILDLKEKKWLNLYNESNFSQKNQLVVPRWPLYIFLFGAIFCLSCSAFFHLFSAHSKKWNNLLNRLDYAGISILILGSCYPPYYYFFYCNTGYIILYLGFMTVFGLLVFAYSLNPNFGGRGGRSFKGFLFLTYGISAGIPLIQLALFPYLIII